MRFACLATLSLTLLAGCGDDDGTDVPAEDMAVPADMPPPIDHPFAEMPASTVAEEGVRRDVFRVPGATPPANPVTGDETPSELNFTQVLRYRADTDPPTEARAIVVAMPGFLGGGGSIDGLARALVREGLEGGEAIEVWAIDRRSNMLEDLRGADAAEAQDDPEIADGYYYEDETVGGEAFEGYVRQSEVPYMSEWGLATHVEDLHAVIGVIPEEHRRTRTFLLGHSLGASFAEAYAAWRFGDGDGAFNGFDELAGIILVDGLLGATPSEETDYLEGTSAGGFPQPGVTGIRERTRYTELPLLGVAIYTRTEILSLRALLDPDAVVDDVRRDLVLGTLLSLNRNDIPPMSNAAAIALGFDDQHGPLAFARAKLGTLEGPTEEYTSALGGDTLLRPSNPETTYTWNDAPDSGEVTSIADIAQSFTHGRSNFAEWYFPSRLPVDLGAVGGAAIPEDGWQADAGLRAFDGAAIDAPILAVACGLIGDPSRYEALRDRIPTPVGDGRPQAGATREEAAGLTIVDAVDIAHLDPTLSSDGSANATIPETLAFVGLHAAAGGVTVPVMVME
jgi:pimeloyl-ACP methyl ester carboxylesterase